MDTPLHCGGNGLRVIEEPGAIRGQEMPVLRCPVPLIQSRLIPGAPTPPCPGSAVGTLAGSFSVTPEMRFAP